MTTSLRIAFSLALLSFPAVAQHYVISTIAGGAPPATPVRGLDMPLNVRGVATDAAGNVYFTSALSCIFKLDSNGIVTLAGQVAGLMQVNIRIPNGVQPGGCVPVVLQVGDASTPSDAVWIAVGN